MKVELWKLAALVVALSTAGGHAIAQTADGDGQSASDEPTSEVDASDAETSDGSETSDGGGAVLAPTRARAPQPAPAFAVLRCEMIEVQTGGEEQPWIYATDLHDPPEGNDPQDCVKDAETLTASDGQIMVPEQCPNGCGGVGFAPENATKAQPINFSGGRQMYVENGVQTYTGAYPDMRVDDPGLAPAYDPLTYARMLVKLGPPSHRIRIELDDLRLFATNNKRFQKVIFDYDGQRRFAFVFAIQMPYMGPDGTPAIERFGIESSNIGGGRRYFLDDEVAYAFPLTDGGDPVPMFVKARFSDVPNDWVWIRLMKPSTEVMQSREAKSPTLAD